MSLMIGVGEWMIVAEMADGRLAVYRWSPENWKELCRVVDRNRKGSSSTFVEDKIMAIKIARVRD
jgi:hypothetical protein